ncbi:MAG: ATP-binding cassette domain-containing protein [Gammaproteobacteria bacterium]|nr:ATP-binding cassette domain-containing protein [Gammaproteobacteria bacterium]MBL6999500.1 ATP-binding cassette domain-containing protein [Gammaproteobacteria bacterium]
MTQALIQIRNLHFSRGQNKIFDGIDMDISAGRITAIMGPSGTGKTTLLKMIGGQLHPEAGEVIVDGQNVHRLKRSELYQLRKKMGMLFQSGALLTDLTVFENIAYPLREHTNLSESMIYSMVLIKLQAVGLSAAHTLMPAELSGGMARRVALARALALDPMMIMYDEPFTGQDPISLGVLVKLIQETNSALKLTSIMVSHDVNETMSIADDVKIISQGKVVAAGTRQEIEQSDSAWVRQFIDGQADGPVPFHYPGETIEQQLMKVTK